MTQYKILIKYTSTFKRDFYYFYIDEDTGEEFVTDDVDILNNTVKKLDKQYGHENIRTIVDISYDVTVSVDPDSRYEFVTDEEMNNLYQSAFQEVFGKDGGDQ